MENQKTNYAETNPKEIATIFTGSGDSKTGLLIESHFSRAEIKDKCAPQEIYHDKYSRYIFYLISKGASKIANLPAVDLAEVEARTQFARQKLYELELCPPDASAVPDSPAYSVRMPMGEFKGKSPAEALLEDGNNLDKLREQYKYLMDNLKDHPNNKKLMDAINEAANLFKAGKLQRVSTSSVFTIYSKEKINPHKPRGDGMFPVYVIDIRCYINNSKYPVEVTIQNYDAPRSEQGNGMGSAITSKMDKSTYKKGTINIAMKDWTAMVEKMREQKDVYTILFAKDRFAAADEQQKANQQKNQVTPIYDPEED